MSKHRVSAAVLAISLLGLSLAAVARGSRTAVALTNCDTSTADLNPAESQMLSLINAARASAGMVALKSSPGLNRAAAWKSGDPSATGSGGVPFSHTDSFGRPPSTRAQQCGYPGQAAENIAFGFGAAQATFDAWMGSSGHRCNINGTIIPGHDASECPAALKSLVANYKVLGVGQVGSAWTADFGSVDDSGFVGLPSPPSSSPPSGGGTAGAGGGSTSTPTPTPVAATATPTHVPTATPPPPAALGISVPLSPGENLVIYAGSEEPVMVALRSLTDAVVVVYEWQPAGQRWMKFSPGKPGYVNTFSTMKPGGVYSIQVSSDATWAY